MVESYYKNTEEWLIDAFDEEIIEIFLKGSDNMNEGIVGKVIGCGNRFISLEYIDPNVSNVFICGKIYHRDNIIHIAVADISTIRLIKE